MNPKATTAHARDGQTRLTYDVVVCTLNRLDSLTKCLSLLERQTERPQNVIVVDASDDHQAVREVVLRKRREDINWEVLHATRRNASYQRNLGLDRVTGDIVFLPDDDSMLYPGSAAEIMDTYRADVNEQIGGVSGVAAPRSPLGAQAVRSRNQSFKDITQGLRNRIDRTFAPAPFYAYSQSLWSARPVPDWIDGINYALVEGIIGFLMSLRANLARQYRFDETLGYGIGYALHEDMELSLRIQKNGHILISTHRAPIFHDAYPSRRAGGFNYGFCWLANYMYVCRKNMPDSFLNEANLARFLRYKMALYHVRALTLRDGYSKEVVTGASTAWRERDKILAATPSGLTDAYQGLCDQYVRK